MTLSLIGTAISFVLIDVCLALIALVVGFVSAMWYLKITHGMQDGEGAGVGDSRDTEAQINDAERANMAALQLRDLAQNMAQDVGEHSTLVEQITDQLVTLPSEGKQDHRLVVTEAIKQIVVANKQLNGKLAEAESKIHAQAEEIRLQQSEARTDALTHLANRRAFDDAHGHQARDEVLRSIGRTHMREVREFAGHSDIRTTELFYARREEDAEMAARSIQIRIGQVGHGRRHTLTECPSLRGGEDVGL